MPGIFISAGEASGDHYGAQLIAEMLRLSPVSQLEFSGLCGPEMRARGCEAIVPSESVAHMGITEVVFHARHIYRQFSRLKASIATRCPSLAILIDFPDVNFRLAKHCRRLGIPVLWLVSPQLWAWKKYRLRWVQQRVSKMLVIFPFEEKFYRDRGVDAEFIGHPLADLPLPEVSRHEYAREYGLDPAKQWIALLPGSRAREFAMNFPALRDAAALLGDAFEYLIPIAGTLNFPEFSGWVANHSLTAVRLTPVKDARAALFHARTSAVASGTATVQAALMGNPFVIVYRMSPLSYRVARSVITAPFAGMPNLIAGSKIVPELLQNDFTGQRVAAALRPLLSDGAERATMIANLIEVQRSLIRKGRALPNMASKAENVTSTTAMARAAEVALSLLDPSR